MTHRQPRRTQVVQRYLGEAIAEAPANRKLTAKQKALVDVLVTEPFDENGKPLSLGKAAEKAGYKPGNQARVVAANTLRLPHVRQYLLVRAAEALGLGVAPAVARLLHLSRAARSERIQLEASRDILDRAGMRAPERHEVSSEVKLVLDLDPPD